MLTCLSAWYDARQAFAGAPRELWLALVPLRFLTAVPYYTLALIFVGFVERAYGFDDKRATFYDGVWSACNTVLTLLGGWICDSLGVRRTLIVGAVFSFAGFITLATVPNYSALSMAAIFVLIPAGIGLGLPVCDVAARRLSSPSNESLVYPLAYSVATMGQLVGLAALAISSAVYFSEARRHDTKMEFIDRDTTVERFVLYLCAACALPLVGIARLLKVNRVVQRVSIEKINDDGDGEDEASVDERDSMSMRALVASLRRGWSQKLMSLRGNRTVWRVALLIFITLPARHVFMLLYATLSIYIRRTLGVDVPVYAFMLIDPALEWALAPLFAIFCPQFDIYLMMVLGSLISSIGLVGFIGFEPTVVSIGCTLAVFAVGSAIYVPRVSQYVLVLAPDGQEGQFAALSSTLPIAVGKIIIGLLFGSLLDKSCSVHAAGDTCWQMWQPSVIASFCTPVLMIVFYKFIHTEDVRQKFATRLDTIREVGARARSALMPPNALARARSVV